MLNHLKNSLIALSLMTLVTGLFYPMIVTLLTYLMFHHQATGSLIVGTSTSPGQNSNGVTAKICGSELIGQSFSQPKYFWGRLSATGSVPYNATASGGSNLGPSNPALLEAARGRLSLLLVDQVSSRSVPLDLLTASGSGLDPHISPAAAEFQLPRVAKARGVPENELRKLVEQFTEGPQFGLLGMPRVNVLKLNLALDRS